MEELDDLLYDDVEAKYLALQNKKKKRKKRRRKYKVTILVVLLVGGFFYFSSSASKVKSLTVSGNIFYTKDTVLKKAKLSFNSRYIVIPKFYIEWQLKKDAMLEDVEVSKDWKGSINIQIKEKTVIGYFIDNEKSYALISDGTRKEITSDNLNTIVNFPLIDGFSAEELQNLAKAFAASSKEVKREIISMISEILPHKESYDKNMVQIVMQDGNKIFTSYDSVYMLNSYKNVLKDLKKDHVCFVVLSKTEAFSTEDCASFK